VPIVAWWKGSLSEPLVGILTLGAIAATAIMVLIPTDRERAWPG